jgi:hypothetical protein
VTNFLPPSHLKVLRLVIDGNHHANRYTKNSDPADSSLLEGRASGYFPSAASYSDYLNKIPATKEVIMFTDLPHAIDAKMSF